jgi:hypothetical protein
VQQGVLPGQRMPETAWITSWTAAGEDKAPNPEAGEPDCALTRLDVRESGNVAGAMIDGVLWPMLCPKNDLVKIIFSTLYLASVD